MDDVDQELKDFVRGQVAKNTTYSTNTARNFFKRHLVSKGGERDLENIPPNELSRLISLCLKNATKKNGEYFEPDVLSMYYQGLSPYLIRCDYLENIIEGPSFEFCREVLAAKRKEIKQQGGGNRPNKTRELTEEEEDLLWSENYFSDRSPEYLRNAICWLLSLHFGFRARH